ncbi:protein containing Peptidase M24B, X-Pro dipeptidase/aminopeptidase P [mine drainage metagenome]|uniref:Protein containing Peptidase M24B, X-Pro dipeptidase/aminopeptidase P n=1 Tax=mine drainage metagenome TaxID=410659 RepID=T1BVH9_9ZZZZ
MPVVAVWPIPWVRAIAILPTAPERVRNADTHHPYRWDSHFHYLTEFPEPEAVLVLQGGKKPTQSAVLSSQGS